MHSIVIEGDLDQIKTNQQRNLEYAKKELSKAQSTKADLFSALENVNKEIAATDQDLAERKEKSVKLSKLTTFFKWIFRQNTNNSEDLKEKCKALKKRISVLNKKQDKAQKYVNSMINTEQNMLYITQLHTKIHRRY